MKIGQGDYGRRVLRILFGISAAGRSATSHRGSPHHLRLAWAVEHERPERALHAPERGLVCERRGSDQLGIIVEGPASSSTLPPTVM